jgi:uncharacterized damage-inducible protein DinB
MDFDLKKSIEILARTPNVIYTLLQQLPREWTSENEGGDTWSACDIVAHLVYCEKADWMLRAEIILSEHPDKKFEPFNRLGHFQDSKGKTLEQLLQEFKDLRKINLDRLFAKQLSEEQLTATGIHPAFGAVHLSQLLAAWVVHDLNHISQISRVMARQYEEAVGPWKEYLGILKR